MEVFELWVIPERKNILVTDRPGLPVGATEKYEFSKWA